MTIDELHDVMITRFERVDSEFAKVASQFAHVDSRFAEVDRRFAAVDRRFAEVDRRFAAVDRRFAAVDTRFANVDSQFAKLREELKTESETTRRHFDIIAEKMHDAVKIVAEATAHHAVRIDDHERRLKRLERS